ncbi:uncharacterized protein LOC142221550 [Haematobia irritans]|uniref:uncharacterized protein LOC142221550 n=1 Tax=Haematobia irritans TaxID=7368 RepID=UPI003F50A33E
MKLPVNLTINEVPSAHHDHHQLLLQGIRCCRASYSSRRARLLDSPTTSITEEVTSGRKAVHKSVAFFFAVPARIICLTRNCLHLEFWLLFIINCMNSWSILPMCLRYCL